MSRREDAPLRALRRLATSHGVRPFYRDVEGVRQDARPHALVAVLRALGEPVESPADAPAALAARRRRLARRRIEPVCVAWHEGGVRSGRVESAAGRHPHRASLRVLADGPLDCRLELEDGEPVSWRAELADLPVVGHRHPGGSAGGDGTDPAADALTVRRLFLPPGLPTGYHHLSVRDAAGGAGAAGELGQCLVLSAPRRFFDGGAEAGSAAPSDWGVFLPTYALRREGGGPGQPGGDAAGTDREMADSDFGDLVSGDLGVGDLTGLEQLGRWVGGLGGTTVATLPMLAAFLYEDPESYSPYAPASRLFWNELFVDPSRLP